MAYLIDTSVLGRLANKADTRFGVAAHAVLELHRRGELLHITPHVLVEFRNMATRPKNLNGLGLSVQGTETNAASFEASFPLLVETSDIFPAWKALVSALGVVGKQVHDARLIAICHVNRVTHLLTFNLTHFTRMATFGPGVVVVDPATV